MNQTDYVKNDLDFTTINIPKHNVLALYGHTNIRMPDFKRAIEKQGYAIGNFRHLQLGRMEKYNPNEKDKIILSDHHAFTLIGNPVMEAGNGEHLIINDLEQRMFEWLKLGILYISNSTKLNSSYSLSLSPERIYQDEIFDDIKTRGKQYVTIISSAELNSLKNDSKEAPAIRNRILEGLFQGKLDEKNDFVKFMKDSVHWDEDLVRYEPGLFKGLRFMTAITTDYGARIRSTMGVNKRAGYLLAVNPKIEPYKHTV